MAGRESVEPLDELYLHLITTYELLSLCQQGPGDWQGGRFSWVSGRNAQLRVKCGLGTRLDKFNYECASPAHLGALSIGTLRTGQPLSGARNGRCLTSTLGAKMI